MTISKNIKKIKYLETDYSNYTETSMKEQFEESYEILCKTNEPFHIKMKKIYEVKNLNADDFTECTGLHRNYYRKFIKKGYIPRMSTFISMCMGLNLDLPAAESLLASLSLGFEKTDRLDCAYMFLLTHYQGLCIEDCNTILNSLGVNEQKYLLGTFGKEE